MKANIFIPKKIKVGYTRIVNFENIPVIFDKLCQLHSQSDDYSFEDVFCKDSPVSNIKKYIIKRGKNMWFYDS